MTNAGQDVDAPAGLAKVAADNPKRSKVRLGNGREYKGEDAARVDLSQAHEQCRGNPQSPARTAKRYIKRVLYGNRRSLLDRTTHRRPRDVTPARLRAASWMFELVFDYGEHI